MTSDQEANKKKRPRIGGIDEQYATFGRGKASEQQSVQEAKRLDIQTLDVPSIQEVEHSAARDASSLSAQKPKRNKQTVYLTPENDDWIRERIIQERKRVGRRVEISDVINQAIERMRQESS